MRLNVTVPPEYTPFVKELVSSGSYTTAEEVVCDALAQMRDRRAKFEALKATFDEAIAELDRTGGKPLDFDEIKRKGREKLAEYRRQPHHFLQAR